jgi:hypothetical protein
MLPCSRIEDFVELTQRKIQVGVAKQRDRLAMMIAVEGFSGPNAVDNRWNAWGSFEVVAKALGAAARSAGTSCRGRYRTARETASMNCSTSSIVL